MPRSRSKIVKHRSLLVSTERVERSILVLRGQKVILDTELAALYGVTTKRLNEQVKRNADRFPPDFMFRLTRSERAEVVANCDHLAQLKFSPTLPNAFTEHGALMAASVLNSQRAIDVSIFIVRAFVRLRQLLASNDKLRRQLEAMERKYDHQFTVVFDAIRQLMDDADEPPKPRIGFDTEAAH